MVFGQNFGSHYNFLET